MDRKLIIVNDTKTLSQLITHINSHTTFAYDTETTGLVPVRDKVIGFSISGKIGEAYYIPHLTWDKKAEKLVEVFSFEKTKELLNLLKNKELLMWNGSFDVRFTREYFGVDFVDELLADVMLMKHTVQEEGFFGLKPTAIQYQKEIELDVEKEANEEQIALKINVEENGGSLTKANYEMYKADLDVMGVYAAADADLTLRLAHLFRDKLEKEDLVDFFYDEEIMPLYKLVTIPMESESVKLDINLINTYRNKIIKDIKKLHDGIISDLLDIDKTQNWLNDKAATKFPPKKTGNFAQRVVHKFALPLPLAPSGKYRVTRKLVEGLPESNAKQFLLGNQPLGYKSVVATDLSRKMYPKLNEVDGMLIGWSSVEKDISVELWEQHNGGKINISSKKQMSEIVFDYIGIRPLNKTKLGAPQFDDAMIQILAETGFTWASKLSDYNKLIKIKSAYMDRFLDNQINGGYYFYYKQHGTLSGRYSSDAQQLPRPKEEGELSPLVLEYNNAIRAFFVAGKGRKFIDCDYNSLEPVVFSHVSNDEGLRDIFRNGDDFYSTIAIQTEKLIGVSANKKADNFLGKVDKPLRQKAKAYSLGIPYGMTPYALAKTLGVEQKEAEKLYNGYLDGFPELKQWMHQSKLDAQYKGFVKTQTGRVRHLDKVKDLHKKHGEKLLNFRYRNSLVKKLIPKLGKFEAEKEIKGLYLDYKNGINNARNVQIQGLSASIVNRAMIAIAVYLKDNNINGYVCGTVHDQIILNVPEKVAVELAPMIETLMCQTTKLSVDLFAPPCIADNWYDSH